MTMEGPRSAFSTSSSSAMHSSTSAGDQKVEPEDSRSGRATADVAGADTNGGSCRGGSEHGGGGGGRGATSQEALPHHQMTPSKRRTVLNISPPPQDLLDDSRMSCQDETSLDSEQSNSIWMEDSLSNFSVMSTVSYNDNTEVPRKSRKRTPRQRPGPKAVRAEEASMDMFDADSAKGPHFVLSQLGPDSKTGSKGRFVFYAKVRLRDVVPIKNNFRCPESRGKVLTAQPTAVNTVQSDPINNYSLDRSPPTPS